MVTQPLIIPATRKQLVLASTSRYRLALLASLGVEVETCAPDFDERGFDGRGMQPSELALALARGKAESVAEQLSGSWILAGDQLLDLDGRILGKPGTAERAVQQLMELSGRKHRLVTALVLMDSDTGQRAERVLVHYMLMRSLERRQLVDYVERDQPLDCAGSYKVEGLGAALFESMGGQDHTAIVGLPVTALTALLTEAHSWSVTKA